MPTGTRTPIVIAISFLVFLSGCGGGSGDDKAVPDGAPPPQGNPVTVVGPITAFGSIFVAGIEFETRSARVEVDDRLGTPGDLRLGMVVVVQGTVDAEGRRGEAQEIRFDDEVQGPIERISTNPSGNRKTLAVLGRQVAATRGETVFEKVTFDTLATGQVIEVSGIVGPGGVIEATRIERKSARFDPGVSEIEIKGIVGSVQGTTFTLDRFVVDFSAADLSGIPGGEVASGMGVEVKGRLSGTTIQASRVQQEDQVLVNAPGEKLRIEGLVTDFVSPSDFRVQGQRVDASAATLLPPGLVLRDGIRIEVEGPVVGGVLRAVKVEAQGAATRIHARTLSVDAAAGSVVMDLVPGTVTVSISPQTSMRDDLSGRAPFTPADIGSGDFLEIRGTVLGERRVVAGEVRRDEIDDDIVQGPVTDCVPGDRIVVLGLPYTIQDGVTRFEDLAGDPLPDSAAFCQALAASGTFAKIKDDERRRDGIADEVELEN